MPLVTSKEILARALQGGYAVGGFNTVNIETSQAIIGAAMDERSPVIVQVTQSTLKYTEPDELAALIRIIADKADIPIALHLDHGRTFEIVMRFPALGFTSVMIDGSLQPDGKTPRTYEENVEVTRKVVEAAHAIGVTVEGEIGTLGQIERETSVGLTDPDQAAQFVEDTGVDLLAVAVGTAHGLYRGTPIIDHDRLTAIRRKVRIPLVMHGGTGTPDKDVQSSVKSGIAKINIDTQIRVAFFDAVRNAVREMEEAHQESDRLGDPKKYDIRMITGPARDAMRAAIADRIRVFGSSGKAG